MTIPLKEKKHFCLIGSPLGHSVSPLIHKELHRCAGIVGDYTLEEIKPEELESAVKNKLLSRDGFNVTIPHKSSIIPFLDSLSSRAELFGAVNTVEVKDGKLYGHNTDCTGFLRSIESENISVEGEVLILGCGGVSRMFAYECAMAGADITLAVRKQSFEKAGALQDEIYRKTYRRAKLIKIEEAVGEYSLIINGTPVGMFPNTDACPVSRETVERSGAVFDAVYNPLDTKLIQYARESKVKNANGLAMLVWQAAAAEEIWNGVEFKKEDIDKIIKTAGERLGK